MTDHKGKETRKKKEKTTAEFLPHLEDHWKIRGRERRKEEEKKKRAGGKSKARAEDRVHRLPEWVGSGRRENSRRREREETAEITEQKRTNGWPWKSLSPEMEGPYLEKATCLLHRSMARLRILSGLS